MSLLFVAVSTAWKLDKESVCQMESYINKEIFLYVSRTAKRSISVHNMCTIEHNIQDQEDHRHHHKSKYAEPEKRESER